MLQELTGKRRINSLGMKFTTVAQKSYYHDSCSLSIKKNWEKHVEL